MVVVLLLVLLLLLTELPLVALSLCSPCSCRYEAEGHFQRMKAPHKGWRTCWMW